jgi:hypothetical protein
MARWFNKLKALAEESASWASGGRVPFAVVCACGETLSGNRTRERQRLRCERCQRTVFVLPASSWPRVPRARPLAGVQKPPARPEVIASRARPWIAPVIGGAAALVLLAAGTAWLLTLLFQPDPDARQAVLREHLAAAKHALADGQLAAAAEQADRARALINARPALTNAAQSERVIALQRQIAIITELHDQPLENLLLRAAQLPADAWEREFQERHLGRSVVLETTLTPHQTDPTQRRAAYQVLAGKERAWLVIDDPVLTGRHDLGEVVVFGGRLAGFRLEAAAERTDPVWHIQFQLGTMVSLTEPNILRRLYGRQGEDRRPIEPAVAEFTLEGHQIDPLKAPRADEVETQRGRPRVTGRQFTRSCVIEQWSFPDRAAGCLIAGPDLSELWLWQPGQPLPAPRGSEE